MSNVNDNNLDDLLRRAAEKYPLRTDSADWGKLVADLDKDPSLVLPPMNGEDRRRRRRFFWLFLLLPLAGAGYYAWHAGKPASLAGQTNVTSGQANVAAGQTNVASGQANVAAGQASVATKQKGGHVGGEHVQASEKAGQAGDKGGQMSAPAGEKGGHVGGEKGGQAGQVSLAGQNGQTGVATGKDGQVRAGVARSEKGGHVGGKKEGQADQVSAAGQGERVNGLRGGESAKLDNLKSVQDDKGLHLASNNVQRVNTKMRGDVSASQIKVNAANAKKDNIKIQKPKPSFYVGILGSPDLSTIKWQSVKNVGTRYGLLLGYSFNSKWSIETGAYYSKKKYFTDGEYFDKTNAYILKYVDQLKVDGVCNMWEIPLSVRYNFPSGEKMKWFATAGVSAYYMSREKYDCSGYLNGAAWWQEWNKKPSHNSWSTNLNFSVGYEQRLGKIGNLRLEPYVRVPMSGIGTGKLSIMSAGLNIGITRRIW